jgi:uncharacterized membrane protein
MYEVWFAVRYLHLLSAAVLLGGAILLAWGYASPSLLASSSSDALAIVYERAFWLVVALLTLTGVSNLGLKGAGLLGVDARWGRVLLFKLVLALLLFAGSFVRTTFVSQHRRGVDADGWAERTLGPRQWPGKVQREGPVDQLRDRRVLTMLYAATALTLCGVLWVGLGLAHGRY